MKQTEKQTEKQNCNQEQKETLQHMPEREFWMDLSLFYAKMRELDTNVVSLAETIGISTAAMYRKLKGESRFKLDEIKRLKEVMKLNEVETYQIFIAGYLTEAA